MEVKSAEGAFSEAVISKLTDASWYTVGKCITQQLLTVTSTRLSLSLVVYIISLPSNNLCVFCSV